MISVTKIFHFEMAHAVHGYDGPCKNIHGHSYELHVTIAHKNEDSDYLPAPGFIIDFKALKKMVNTTVVDQLDHALVLSEDFLKSKQPAILQPENLRIWKMEPTAENLLLYVRNVLEDQLPEQLLLYRLKIYETADSYAEWECSWSLRE